MMKSLKVLMVVGVLSMASTMTSMANWEQVGTQWKYSNNGVYLTGWQWLDGNGDGVAECYYLGTDGTMAVSTVIGGYTVDINGAWIIDGVVQTKVVGSGGQTSNSNSGGHQNQSGIPDFNELISGVTSSNMDNSDVQAGDSTGLPPMQAGTGNNSGFTVPSLSIGNVGSLDWEAECGDSTGLPPME